MAATRATQPTPAIDIRRPARVKEAARCQRTHTLQRGSRMWFATQILASCPYLALHLEMRRLVDHRARASRCG